MSEAIEDEPVILEAPTPRRKRKRTDLNSKLSILRVRMHKTTLARVRRMAEYERVKAGETGEGKHMSTLVLSWVLEGLEAFERRRAVEELAKVRAADLGFSGLPPDATEAWPSGVLDAPIVAKKARRPSRSGGRA